jgi:hypothetical protein
MRAVTKPAKGVLLLLVLLAGFPLIASLPNQVGAIRLAGLSLLWWYGGVIAPVLAVLVAGVWLAAAPPARQGE